MREHAVADDAVSPRARTAWTDWLLDRLYAVPWPLWLTLTTLIIVGVVMAHLMEWWLGPLEVGEFTLYRASYPFYPFGMLAAIALQRRVSLSALEQFRPAIPTVDHAEYRRIEQHLTRQPALISLIAAIPFAVIGMISLTTVPGAEERLRDYPAAFYIDILLTLVTYSFAGPWLVSIFRLLRTVSALHRRATVLDLFHPAPLHAFATVTATVSASLIAIVTFSTLTDPASRETSSELFLSGLMTTVAAVCFLLPLWGMHRRLQEERRRLIGEASARIERVRDQLYEQVDRDEPGATEAKDRLAALVSLRELTASLSTWPWRPETPRWLFSALLVPLVLWGVTRFLERAGL